MDDDDAIGTRDMTVLSNLTVEGVNDNLKLRYAADLVYTYTGTILISVNPYKHLHIYGTDHITSYHARSSSEAPPPHIYAIAEQAYNSLIRSYDETNDTTTNQSVVISGESGAGKTETTKFILQYLCHVTSNVSTWVENQILEANTILEAFGNAKTVRNDNSSRFGKFMQVCFDSKWMIRGCIIQDYLLEQSRITFQSKGERNYHVFYQLISAARNSREMSEQYGLNQHTQNRTQFAYLQHQADTTTPLDPLLLALQILQIPQTHVTGLFSTLSAILHLGNLEFTPSDSDGETATLTPSDSKIIATVSNLLNVNEPEFSNVILTRQINVRGNITEIPLRVNEASENRHAMSKALYSRCFGWLIAHINERTNPGQDSSKVIGLLDIFGFENFEVNSFEQMCINYANEKLHKFFNQAVFQIEQEMYRSEGLNISEITFTDNNAILELIEKPPRCILKLLTEQCHLPKGSDLGFLNNLHTEFDTHHPCYEKGDDRRNWENRFTFILYAGKVTYTVHGFVDKNRDVQQDLFFNTLEKSGNEFIKNLASIVFEDTKIGATTIPRNTSKGRPTVAETFRGQLQQLVEVLANTKAWYVRCIKPNEFKVPDSYDEGLVIEQLKYLGMLEIIRIRKEGYPVHLPFDEFSARYRIIGKFRTYRGAKDTCSHVLETLNATLPPPPHRTAPKQKSSYLKPDQLPPYYYQLGSTRAFLKPEMHELLECQRTAVIRTHVITIQRFWRGFKARKSFASTRTACITIQRAYRSWTSRLVFLKRKRAAITIQCYIRGFFAREVAVALREMRRVEDELRKREIERKRASSVAESSDDGRSSARSTSDDEVVGGTKDVSLDNLFEFLLVNSNNNNNTTLDKLSYEMDELANEMNGLEDARAIENATVTNSNSICSSMSNFELEEAEFDADNDDVTSASEYKNVSTNGSNSLACTPTNHDDEDIAQDVHAIPPPPSPPPLIPPPENLPCVAKISRLPEPTEKPPPPPVMYADKKVVNKVQDQPPVQQRHHGNKVSKDNGEPIYESIRPRIIMPPPQQILPVQHQQQPRQQQPVPMGMDHENGFPKLPPQTRVVIQQQAPPAPPAPPQALPSRVEKRVNEIIKSEHNAQAQGDAGVGMMEGGILTFQEYALQYFSLENRKSGQTEAEYVAEATCYTKNYHIHHPHLHLYDPSNVQVCVFMFRDLNKLMKGELKPETEVQAMQTIIGYGIEREELRDEIYGQVFRQVTSNPNVEFLERLYLVFCLAIVSFPPGKVLARVISHELSRVQSPNHKVSSQVKWILDNIQDLKIRGYVRKLPPSSVEIQAMKRLGTIVCRFFFLDGRTKAIDIHPTDTAYDAIVKLGEKIGVSSPQYLVDNGWAVYQVRPSDRVEEHVPSHTYVYDVIAQWELGNADKAGVTLGCGDNRFVFKKRLFKGNSREIPQDPVECALLYAQAVFSVVKRDDYPVAEKVSLQLAGLQAQVLFTDPPTTQKSFDNYTNVEAYLPTRVARTRPHQQWVPILAQAHRTYGSGKSELVARVWYLSCVMQYPLYGTTMFHVVYRGYWVYGNSLVLGVSSDGISMIKSDDKFIMYEYAYNQVESVSIEPSERLLTINLNRSLPPDTHKCFVFETNSTSEIAGLISSYCPALSASRTNANSKVGERAHQLTNNDRSRLYGSVVAARKSLIESGLLRRPDKPIAGVKLLKNTLRRLSKQKMERMRMYEQQLMMSGESRESTSEFPIEWFCYSKHALTTSLSTLPPELESIGIQVFQQVCAFATFSPVASNASTGSPVRTASNQDQQAGEYQAAGVLQNVFEKVWRSDQLINELFLQIIKQTTDHPEPNSRVNARYWGVLSLLCSLFPPPDQCVRKYLNAHLKRCAITDFVTEEGKFARFAEKCLQHTITSSSVSTTSARRQWPPSRNEILCTVNRKPITARFHFMDGKYHTLQFAPNDTAADLIVSLTTKIGLPQGAKGYAIYEVSLTSPMATTQDSTTSTPSPMPTPNTPWERSLNPNEKPVEVISRWERQKPQSSSTTSSTTASTAQFKFVIRKHLYESLDLSNPIEKELVYHQLLSSARNDRFPVSDTEAAMLVALQAQVELGDYASTSAGEFPDYCHVSAHCLPTRIAALVSHEAVARHHQSLVGTPANQAKQTVLNLLMSWPLFKCIVFDVQQSFTSNWPRNLWLALDSSGLHLLPQRTRHTLCTFEYQVIKSYSPSPTCFMIVTRGNNEGTSMMNNANKIVLTTNQAYQIAQLIKQFVYTRVTTQ